MEQAVESESEDGFLSVLARDCRLTRFQLDLLDACGARSPSELLALLTATDELTPHLDYQRLALHAMRSGALRAALHPGRRELPAMAFGCDARRRTDSHAHGPVLQPRGDAAIASMSSGATPPQFTPVQLPHLAGGQILGVPKVRPLATPSTVVLPCWPVRHQGDRGTCVAFATCAAHEVHHGVAQAQFSPQFLFWAAKTCGLDPNPVSDGTRIEYACHALATTGVCVEAEWPYAGNILSGDVTHATTTAHPSASARANAMKFACPTNLGPWQGGAKLLLGMLKRGRAAVISLPVVVLNSGTQQVTNWTTDLGWEKGIVFDPPPTPSANVQMSTLGHAVCVTGFVANPVEPTGGYFIFRNSWGTDWGRALPDPAYPHQENGYGRVSASYVDRFLVEVAELG